MPKKQSNEERAILDAADALAEFANLESADARAFRHRHLDFLPQTFWTGPAAKAGIGIYVPWIRERDLVRQTWARTFPADLSLELVTSQLFLMANVLESTDESTPALTSKVWPYQKAVLFLQANSWRVKKCEECGRCFVADHAKRKYCSIASENGSKCSAVVIKRTHLEWGRENNWGRKKTTR